MTILLQFKNSGGVGRSNECKGSVRICHTCRSLRTGPFFAMSTFTSIFIENHSILVYHLERQIFSVSIMRLTTCSLLNHNSSSLSSVLMSNREFDEILKTMKWPLISTVPGVFQAPQYDVLALFEKVFCLLLDIHLQYPFQKQSC